MKRGWQAPIDKPYQALGEFQDVVPVLKSMKAGFKHTKDMSADTMKNVNRVKRSDNPLFKTDDKPQRTLNIIQGYKEKHEHDYLDSGRVIKPDEVL